MRMQFAAPDEDDLKTTLDLVSLIQWPEKCLPGYDPDVDPDETDDPYEHLFDDSNREHLLFFFRRVRKLADCSRLARVVWGLLWFRSKNLHDPDKDYLALRGEE